jgi:hypothetical protein
MTIPEAAPPSRGGEGSISPRAVTLTVLILDQISLTGADPRPVGVGTRMMVEIEP